MNYFSFERVESVAEAARDSVMDSDSGAPSESTSVSRRKPRVRPHAGPEEPPETHRRVQLSRTEGTNGCREVCVWALPLCTGFVDQLQRRAQFARPDPADTRPDAAGRFQCRRAARPHEPVHDIKTHFYSLNA